ncbi:MAG: magnesium-translocating P-type ATPase [Clostridiales bacterium]|jgi:Mg2+-importing ATPase|nr:magnesium-translocating P-type ATPase [Clostridiales bacterium]
MKKRKAQGAESRAGIDRYIVGISAAEISELFERLGTTPQGYTSEKAEELLDDLGKNVIDEDKAENPLKAFLLAFFNPFSVVLMIVAAASFLTEVLFAPAGQASWATVIIILCMIIISGVLKFSQESKSRGAAQKLKQMVNSTAAVFRDGKIVEIPMSDIVLGDIVHLSSGDMIPADVRVISCKDLFISQAALTGESEPVEKFPENKTEPSSALDCRNIAFTGTNVVSGAARALVVAAGNETYFGHIAKEVSETAKATGFERGVDDVSKLLLRLMLVMVPIIFVVNGIVKSDWLGAFFFALSVAVGLTPELLPMIMTSTLARGALVMSKQKTIVKDLSSIQTFGAMDVLCTDKTGTLTEDKIVLEMYLDIHGSDDLRILKHAYLNSYFQTGVKNLMDIAIIERAHRDGQEEWGRIYTKVDEIPFDFNRRRMSVVLEDATKKRQLITKGAVEEMVKICGYVDYKGEILPMTDELKREVFAVTNRLNEKGLRVLAIAQKNSVRDIYSFGVADESDMVLIGFAGFLDPPKKSAQAAISALKSHGVRIIVLTGDNEKVAETVCAQVGIFTEGLPKKCVLGHQLDKMSEDELKRAIREVSVFAKLAPSQKSKLVALLQEEGHTVGYMGDGINDAPALNRADVGISVDSGVDIAKESADIILLEKDLMVLEKGVMEGRRTFGNIVKYIKMAASSNFGNMFSVLIASLSLPFLPMRPIQILTQNMLYDFSQTMIPLDKMDDEYMAAPRKWDAKSIQRFVFYMGPVSSFFDLLTFLALYFVFGFNTPELSSSFQTGWFLVGLISQTLIVHLIRTAKIPFIESRASKPLLASTLVISVIGLLLPYSPLGPGLEMTAITPVFMIFIALVLALYAAAVQGIKKVYLKKYDSWI